MMKVPRWSEKKIIGVEFHRQPPRRGRRTDEQIRTSDRTIEQTDTGCTDVANTHLLSGNALS